MPLQYSSPRRQLQAAVARAYGSQGDPFLGSLIRGAFTVGKALVKKFAKPKLLPAGFPGGVVGPAIGGAAGGAIINQFPVREVFRRGGELLGMDTRGGGQIVENAAGCPTAKVIDVAAHQRTIPIDPRTGRPRRRINVLNVSALSRATRRLGGFQKRAKRVEAQLSKIAPRKRTRRKSQTTTVRCN